jgi:hypothetical protein
MQLLFTNYNRNKIKNINKRSTSKERHIKTLIVADKSMKDHYDYIDLDAYLNTTVNIVNALFYDPSIGNLINIHIVRLLILDEDNKAFKTTKNASNLLENFAYFQNSINYPINHVNHHNYAILVTKYIIIT